MSNNVRSYIKIVFQNFRTLRTFFSSWAFIIKLFFSFPVNISLHRFKCFQLLVIFLELIESLNALRCVCQTQKIVRFNFYNLLGIWYTIRSLSRRRSIMQFKNIISKADLRILRQKRVIRVFK